MSSFIGRDLQEFEKVLEKFWRDGWREVRVGSQSRVSHRVGSGFQDAKILCVCNSLYPEILPELPVQDLPECDLTNGALLN